MLRLDVNIRILGGKAQKSSQFAIVLHIWAIGNSSRRINEEIFPRQVQISRKIAQFIKYVSGFCTHVKLSAPADVFLCNPAHCIALHQLALELETKVIRNFHNHVEGPY